MPLSYQYKTPNVPHCSVSSSPARYSPSHHFSGWYISPESFAEAIEWHDDLASVVAMLEGDPVSFAKFVFLNYICHDLRRIQQDLQNQQAVAWQQIICFFQWWSTNQVYDWVLNRQYAHQQVTPGSDHTPPDSSTNSSQSKPLPIPPWLSHTPPVHIRTSPTVTEAWLHQWRRELLEEEFPEDPLEGTWENCQGTPNPISAPWPFSVNMSHLEAFPSTTFL